MPVRLCASSISAAISGDTCIVVRSDSVLGCGSVIGGFPDDHASSITRAEAARLRPSLSSLAMSFGDSRCVNSGIVFLLGWCWDFGTGTGILAILAEKLGASEVMAIDNDPWCIENTEENIQVNQCNRIQVALGDQLKTDVQYDIVIANINRHILEQNAQALKAITINGGILLISGLLSSDEEDMIHLFNEKGFQYQKTEQKDGWVAIQFLA